MSLSTNYRVAKPTRRITTCDVCKTRHQKCDGLQPQCTNCQLRAITCSYSNKLHMKGITSLSPEDTASMQSHPRLQISNTDYDRLYSQIFNNIVERMNLEGNNTPKIEEQADSSSGTCSASLPSFYQEVSSILREELKSANQAPGGKISPPNQIKEMGLEKNFEHARKILNNLLPELEVAQRLLNLFFQYQNSVFYIFNMVEAQAQLDLMYTGSDETDISWYCQMFLLFSVGAQFDDLDDGNGESYYQISQKYLDDAMEENPQKTIWVTRVMLLLCFYQPPTKWSSIWISLDVAIRTAQRFELDRGHNSLKDFSDKEYREWRQIWLTLISFDRWVAVFLGRLPRIKDSISKDPIFQDFHFASGLDSCVMQNHITSLAIISGHILRDLYFTEQYSVGMFQQRKYELETWTSTLPVLLRNIELNVALDLPKDQLEAAFNLHFMQLGTWMLLTRPCLLIAVKVSLIAIKSAERTGSTTSADARICIDSAFRLINSSNAMLSESLLPRRSFMPLFFLVNAAHVMILGAICASCEQYFIFRLFHAMRTVLCSRDNFISTEDIQDRQANSRDLVGNMNRKGESPYDQNRELASVDAATRILDLCGQRNAFARKYSVLIKYLRQKLDKHMLNSSSAEAKTARSSVATPTPHLTFPNSSSSSSSSRAISTPSDGFPFHIVGSTNTPNTEILTPPLPNGELRSSYYSPNASANAVIEPWSEHFGIFYPTTDTLSDDHDNLLNNSKLDFPDRMWQ